MDNLYKELLDLQENCDKYLDKDFKEFSEILIDKEIFKSEKDIKIFILENVSRTYNTENFEFPIRYYKPDEELDECDDDDSGMATK